MRPDPFLEFCLGWIDRNPVDTQGREAPVVWDSGQFHQQDGRVTAILDLELGHLGDPMMDLAAFRMRDTVLGFGDMNVLYDQYAEALGRADRPGGDHAPPLRVRAHEPAGVPRRVGRPARGVRLHDKHAVGERDEPVRDRGARRDHGRRRARHGRDVPEPRDSPVANAHEHLVRSLRNLDLADEYERHQLRIAFRLARHLQRYDEIGDACTEADLDDLRQFLPRRPATWQEGDAALEEFVLADGGAHDEELLQLFHRRYLRYKMLCGPEGSAMARHEPIQKFRS